MPDSVTSQLMLSPQLPHIKPAIQRGSTSFTYGLYMVELRYSLTSQKLSLRGYLSCNKITTFANDYHFILYGADGWIVDFAKIGATGRFSFSPPKRSFYSVTLQASNEEYLLGALEL